MNNDTVFLNRPVPAEHMEAELSTATIKLIRIFKYAYRETFKQHPDMLRDLLNLESDMNAGAYMKHFKSVLRNDCLEAQAITPEAKTHNALVQHFAEDCKKVYGRPVHEVIPKYCEWLDKNTPSAP